MRFVVFCVLAACSPALSAPVVEVSAANPQPVAPLGPTEPFTQPQPEAPSKNPFAIHQAWTGSYLCAQGDTDLVFTIMDVRGNDIDAIFEFDHESSGAYGSYRMKGHVDPKTSRVTFVPTVWIEQPPNYTSVGMTGVVKNDRFEGRIDNETCGDFSLALRGAEEWDED